MKAGQFPAQGAPIRVDGQLVSAVSGQLLNDRPPVPTNHDQQSGSKTRPSRPWPRHAIANGHDGLDDNAVLQKISPFP